MPQIAIISDIHGNLEALEAVLKAIETDGVRYIIHLGDLVGYNANPRECLHLLQTKRVISILGNHDHAVLEPDSADNFNVLAFQALSYSIRQLSQQDRQYLLGMPRTEVLWDRYLICHGSPESLETYIMNILQAKRIFRSYPRAACLGQRPARKGSRASIFRRPATAGGGAYLPHQPGKRRPAKTKGQSRPLPAV